LLTGKRKFFHQAYSDHYDFRTPPGTGKKRRGRSRFFLAKPFEMEDLLAITAEAFSLSNWINK
jgi:hypothetical protein